MLWGLLWLSGQCQRQEVTRGCAGRKGSPPSHSQPGLCSCKSKRFIPAAAWFVHPPASGKESSFLPVAQRSLELSQRGSESRWSCSCSCAPETSSGSVLLGIGSARCCYTHGKGLGEEEKLPGLQPTLGVWEGVKLNKQSSIPVHNYPCVEE